MASWTEIPNSSLESGAPVRSVDGVALRDNPVAIAEGATGAPRIVNAAITDGTIGAEKFQTGTEESDWVTGRYSGVSFGEIGCIAVLMNASTTSVNAGGTIAGSSLRYNFDTGTRTVFELSATSGSGVYPSGGTSATGTWRALTQCKGRSIANEDYAWYPSIFVRIA